MSTEDLWEPSILICSVDVGPFVHLKVNYRDAVASLKCLVLLRTSWTGRAPLVV